MEKNRHGIESPGVITENGFKRKKGGIRNPAGIRQHGLWSDLLITAHAHRFWICNQPNWDWLGIPSTALGQCDQVAVPSHHIPAGDDRVGWVSLRRARKTWQADMHPCGSES